MQSKSPLDDSKNDSITSVSSIDLTSWETPSVGTASDAIALPLIDHLGRFRLIRELGRGGCGIVYLAEDEQLGREVAVKLPSEASQIFPHRRQRLWREAKAVAHLQHQNIAKVYEVGEADGWLFAVSEYIAGLDLGKWIRAADRPPPYKLVVDLMIQLCDAVQHAHSRGILHRDIKPGNILLTTSETGEPLCVKLTDFGLACQLECDSEEEPITESGAIVGTLNYMSPEQIRGDRQNIGVRTDIWALVLCSNWNLGLGR